MARQVTQNGLPFKQQQQSRETAEFDSTHLHSPSLSSSSSTCTSSSVSKHNDSISDMNDLIDELRRYNVAPSAAANHVKAETPQQNGRIMTSIQNGGRTSGGGGGGGREMPVTADLGTLPNGNNVKVNDGITVNRDRLSDELKVQPPLANGRITPGRGGGGGERMAREMQLVEGILMGRGRLRGDRVLVALPRSRSVDCSSYTDAYRTVDMDGQYAVPYDDQYSQDSGGVYRTEQDSNAYTLGISGDYVQNPRNYRQGDYVNQESDVYRQGTGGNVVQTHSSGSTGRYDNDKQRRQQQQLQQQQETGDNLPLSPSSHLMGMQMRQLGARCETLQRDLDRTRKELTSCVSSVRTFWSPELKKARTARREELTRNAALAQQLLTCQQEVQRLKTLLDKLKREFRSGRDDVTKRVSPPHNNTGVPSIPGVPGVSGVQGVSGVNKEETELRRTVDDLGARVNQLREMLAERDDTIGKLVTLLNAGCLSNSSSSTHIVDAAHNSDV